MHFGCVVIYTPGQDPDQKIHRFRDKQFDWKQKGGRWTGFFTNYDPEADPVNREPCRRCDGQGQCSGVTCGPCEGKGEGAKWPTEWAVYPGDDQPLAAWDGARLPWRWITPGGEYEAPWEGLDDPLEDSETQDARGRERLEQLKAKYPNARVVIYDLHY